MATIALPTISYEDISGFWALPNDILQHRGVDHHLVGGAVVVGAVVVVVDRRLPAYPLAAPCMMWSKNAMASRCQRDAGSAHAGGAMISRRRPAGAPGRSISPYAPNW